MSRSRSRSGDREPGEPHPPPGPPPQRPLPRAAPKPRAQRNNRLFFNDIFMLPCPLCGGTTFKIDADDGRLCCDHNPCTHVFLPPREMVFQLAFSLGLLGMRDDQD